jgi:hypothetical protein
MKNHIIALDAEADDAIIYRFIKNSKKIFLILFCFIILVNGLSETSFN